MHLPGLLLNGSRVRGAAQLPLSNSFTTHPSARLRASVLCCAVARAGVVVIGAWTVAWALPMFLTLRRLGLLRVDQQTELAGIDNIEHGGPAFPEFVARGTASVDAH